MSSKSLSDRLLDRVIALEAWLEQDDKPLWLLPARIAGYGLLVGFLVASNLVALCRWPIAALLSSLRTNKDPSSLQRFTSDRTGALGGEPIAGDPGMVETLLASDRPVLLDFWAAWCGPCVMMSDSLLKAAQETGENCLIVKIDAMKHQGLVKEYAVKGLPTLVLFMHGKEVERHAGALSYGGIMALLERHTS